MTFHVHHLRGCAPVPLAHYLKALGILRLVATQRDEAARGFWTDEHFCLVTTLEREALVRFFLDEYAPTPAFNPWGGRSGFYAGPSERGAREALNNIEGCRADRLAPFRADIAATRELVDDAGGEKPEDPESKAALLRALRMTFRGPTSEWLDTVMALVGPAFRPPAIIGTGGNEGSGSYLSAYFQAVVECVVSSDAGDSEEHDTNRRRLAHTLFGEEPGGASALPEHAWAGSFGQFMPEGEGSAWDFLLTLEGAVVMRSAVTHRSAGADAPRFLSSPFYLAHQATGGSSDASIDEYVVNKGRRNPGRGEQWFPLWSEPATYPELAAIIAEARCSIGRQTAGRAVDAARAIGRLGVARGISSFVRYGYLQRNNLATHFAVPLGRVVVKERLRVRLLDELAGWLGRVHRAARAKNAPARFAAAEHRLADAVFAAAVVDGAAAWQAVLVAAGDVEAVQATGSGIEAGPLPPLSPGWLDAAAEDSPEWRLAVALGSAAAQYDHGRPVDPVRAHVLPLEKGRYATTPEKRLRRDPRVVLHGRDPIVDLIALVERRIVEAGQTAKRHLPLVAARGLGAQPVDLAELLLSRVDLDRVLLLARALMAVRWEEVAGWRQAGPHTPFRSHLDEAWVALRLCGLPFEVHERRIALDAALVRRLAAGDAAAAVGLALRRLSATGFRPPLVAGTADAAIARRWAAALAFPIDPAVANAMADRFETHATTETP